MKRIQRIFRSEYGHIHRIFTLEYVGIPLNKTHILISIQGYSYLNMRHFMQCFSTVVDTFSLAAQANMALDPDTRILNFPEFVSKYFRAKHTANSTLSLVTRRKKHFSHGERKFEKVCCRPDSNSGYAK